VHYRSLDVSDPSAVTALIHQVTEEHGPIRGLVHAAGVIEDRWIADKTRDQFARVWSTKVPALRAALNSLDPVGLRAVALFSSVSARFGNAGQVDYAMANEVLNKCASQLAHQVPGCRVVSCNWGPWDGGMVSPELKRAFEARGVAVIDLRAGARAFVDELLATSETAAVEVVLGNGLAKPITGSHSPSEQKPPAADAKTSGVAPLPTVLTRPVDVHSHPFLNSHVLAGRAVLPLAMMAEWMANAALTSQPGLHLREIRDIRVLRGLKLNGETVVLRGGCRPGQFTDGFQEVEMDLSSDLGIHARAQALLSTSRAEDVPPPSGFFHQPGNLQPYPMTMEEAYRKHLFHGSDFQGITAIQGIGSQGMRALVRTAPQPADWMANPVRKRWIVDPMLVDTVLQAGILFTQHHAGAPCLPSHIGSILICNPVPTQETPCVLELAVSSLESHRLVADAVLLDGPAGRPLLALKGLEWTVDSGLRQAFAQNGQATAGHHH
jgi:NAD(P)-dependent dehydrogenase (short-subunit alcohol dehydrogenase family)